MRIGLRPKILLLTVLPPVVLAVVTVWIVHNNVSREVHSSIHDDLRLSETLVPVRHVFDFNQALMDFGAMVCVARNPKCLVCPMRASCRAYPWNPEREQRVRTRRDRARS